MKKLLGILLAVMLVVGISAPQAFADAFIVMIYNTDVDGDGVVDIDFDSFSITTNMVTKGSTPPATVFVDDYEQLYHFRDPTLPYDEATNYGFIDTRGNPDANGDGWPDYDWIAAPADGGFTWTAGSDPVAPLYGMDTPGGMGGVGTASFQDPAGLDPDSVVVVIDGVTLVKDVDFFLTNTGAYPGYEWVGDAWMLDIDASGLAGSPVPIPGAAWLLLSGLVGLIGIRRKTA